MRISEAKRKANLEAWSTMIVSRIQSGLSVQDWCSRHGIQASQYYYRLRQVREAFLHSEQPSRLVQVPSEIVQGCTHQSSQDRIRLQFGEAIIDFPMAINSHKLARLLKALNEV